MANAAARWQRVVGDGGVADDLELDAIVHAIPAHDAPRGLLAGELEAADARRHAGFAADEQDVAMEQRVGDLEEVPVVDAVNGDAAVLRVRALGDDLRIRSRAARRGTLPPWPGVVACAGCCCCCVGGVGGGVGGCCATVVAARRSVRIMRGRCGEGPK